MRGFLITSWISRVGALVGGCLVLSGCPAPAEKGATKPPPKPPPPVNMTVEVGQANCARSGMLIPVKVTLGQNEKAISGKLELDDLRGGRTEMAIDLPRQANKVYTLFVPLSMDPTRNSGESAEILVREGGKVLARQLLVPSYLEPSDDILISSTDDGSGLQFLDDRKQTRVAHLQPRELPRQWAGYHPASVVALNGRAWTAMDPDQRKALRVWVERGGRAILCGEATTQWRDPEAEALAGVRASRLATVTRLECLDAWGDTPFRAAGGSLLTVSGPLLPGARPVFAEEGRPLVVSRHTGDGRVLWVGFDAFRQTLREWEGNARFWRRALEEVQRSPEPVAVQTPDEVEDLRAAAGALPRLPVPPMAAIVAFGVVYAFIFGPLNIWILRRLRRTVKAWLFMPALALGMTLVVLVAGQTWGNARTVLNSISVLHATAGGRTAQEQTLVGLFSPTNRAFDLSIEDPAPTLEDRGSTDVQASERVELGWPDSQHEGVARWDAVPLVLFSTRLLHLDRPRDLNGSVSAAFNWADRSRPSGTVTNGSNLPLKSAYLVSAGGYHWLGDLPAGGASPVTAGGWGRQLKVGAGEEAAGSRTSGQFLENERFWESVRRAWRTARDGMLSSPRARDDVWLVAQCDGYRSSLNVSEVPYSNQAGLLLVRIPAPGRGSR